MQMAALRARSAETRTLMCVCKHVPVACACMQMAALRARSQLEHQQQAQQEQAYYCRPSMGGAAAEDGYAPPVDDDELLEVCLCVGVNVGVCVVCVLPKMAMPPRWMMTSC
jgi:hypothetical protein